MSEHNEWIDLTMPISSHVRWHPHIFKKGNFDEGDIFEATTIEVSCHAFTHMDAQRHIKKNGKEILDILPTTFVGSFDIIDISDDIQDNLEITVPLLQKAWPENTDGDKIIFKTCWDTHYSYNSLEYWSKAPYLNEMAAEWIAQHSISLCAFDFPQDYPIRTWIDGVIEKPLEKHVTHKHLLMNGTTLVEYIVNTSALSCKKVWGFMAPIAVANSDGALCRVLVRPEI